MADAITLQAQLDALKAALYAGALTVSYEGKSTTFRDLDQMRGIIAMLEGELGISRPKRVVIRSDKAW